MIDVASLFDEARAIQAMAAASGGAPAAWLLAAPVLIPFAAAALAALAPRMGLSPRRVAVAGAAAHALAAAALCATVLANGPVAAGMGGWEAPLGIALVADALSALMVAATGVMGLAISVYALADIDRRREAAGWFTLYLALLGGASGAFLTGDLFNLYVWFEVMLVCSFGLLVVGGGREAMLAGVRYAALNLVATAAFLSAAGLTYGLAGTLTLAALPQALAGAPVAASAAVSLLLFAALAAKAGLMPLHGWLPAAHFAAPAAASAIFAAVLTKSGVYAIFRVQTLVSPDGPAQDLLLWIGVATMVGGVIGAASETQTNRILNFHIVSQVGYMILGLALGSPLALTGAILYMLHNIVAKANLLLLGGYAKRRVGSYELARSGGLWTAAPFAALLLLISALAMAGLPPLSGFWGKLALARAAAEGESWIALSATLGVGLFTLYSMSKIWLRGWLAPAAGRPPRPLPRGASGLLLGPPAALAVLILAVGLAPQPLLEAAGAAAAGLLDPTAYVDAVLGAPPQDLAALTVPEGPR